MTRLLRLLAAYAALCGAVRCWGDEAPRGVLSVIGRFSTGHGCAIGPNVALVSAHQADPFPVAPTPPMVLRFSLGEQEGLLEPASMGNLPGADIWPYRYAGEFASSVPVATHAPAPGSFVTWWDYDLGGRDEAFGPKKRREKVTRVIAGNIITRKSPERGASGGCVLDETGYVVAIVTWGQTVDGGEVGMLAGVWGQWIPAEQSSN